MLECYIQTPVIYYLIDAAFLLGLLIYLTRFGKRSNTIGWFRIFLTISIIYNLGAAPLRCPPNDTIFSLMVDLYSLTGGITLVVLFALICHFTNKADLLSRYWMRLALFAAFITYTYISWRDPLVVYHDIAHTVPTFGYHSIVLGPHSGIVGTIGLFGFLIPIVMCIHYSRHVENPLKKREVWLVTAALTIIIVPSIVIEGFVQSVFHINVFPVGPFASIIACSLITYALTKYGLRALSLNDVTADLVRVMPGGLIVLDHTDSVQYVNDGAAKMLGYPPAKLSGMPVKHLFYDRAAARAFGQVVTAAKASGAQIAGQETQLATQDKKPLSVSVNVVNVYAGKDLTNRLISFTDITPLKRAQAALENEKAHVERKVVERTHELAAAQAKLSASITGLPLGYIMIDNHYQIKAINPSARHILKTTATEPTMELLSHKLGGYKLHELVAHCLAKRRTIEVKELAVDSRYLHVYISPIIGERKALLGIVILIEDITEQKILERSKDEFFSIASHELRTPLTSIRGNSSMMIEYYRQALKDPELQSMVHDVHESSIRLIGIVNDFLDVSRLEQGKVSFKFSEVNVATQVKSVVKELENEAAQKHTQFRVDPHLTTLPTAIADADRLKQTIFNLLGNALKFTENGTIHVTGQVEADYVRINVTDSGRGIPAASQKLLFRKFQQGGASLITRDTAKGTGLGLYISRLMVEGMGGKIWLDHSEEGKGSTFAFTLPVATAEQLATLSKQKGTEKSTDTGTGITK